MTAEVRVPELHRPARPYASGSMRHPPLVLAVLAAIVLVDQVTKWWAWRHLASAVINPGGDQLVGPVVGRWYSAQLSGAVLDVHGAVVLAVAVWLLGRLRRRLVVVPATVGIAGWSSNALDRLGLHFWTAPGSARGAVDFITVHGSSHKVAVRGSMHTVAVHGGIYNVAEDDGAVSSDKAKRDFGFDAGFRIT